ncbi:hypothetical protein GGR50DRAFT_47103 [Xylaria sp. CBS 124048]|nr:hypothetical protein GGR50DRAFT_47103 [Xylaria sp. CBS 124048]
MPSDYSSTAQALSISPSPPPAPSPSSTSPLKPSVNGRLPPWARSTQGQRSDDTGGDLFGRPRLAGARRLSTPYSRAGNSAADHDRPLGQRITETSIAAMNKLLKLAYSMTPLQRLLAIIVAIVGLALLIVFLVFSHRIFVALHPVAEGWRKLPGGWALLFLLCSITAFPPLVGYSTTITIAGFIFGFPGGWPIVAGATIVGSTAAFFASRTILSGYVHRLVGEDRRFVALGQVLRHDGLLVLLAIRLCPLPFSLSNGFLATIPSVSPGMFALATALASPKLLIHVFIGDRLAQLAENDDMPLSTRIINYFSIVFGMVVGVSVGWVVYQRTMRRANELAVEEALVNDNDSVVLGDELDVEEGVLGPAQSRRTTTTALNGENDFPALMDDDDISLWDTTAEEGNDDDDSPDVYRDEEDSDSRRA